MRNLLHLSTLLLPLGFIAACGGTDSIGSDTSSLNLPNGGYDTSDEAPQFGDSAFGLTGQASEDPAAAGDGLASTDMRDGSALARLDRIALAIVWGHHKVDKDDGDWTDWSGRLTVNGGAIMGVRTIAFDREDHLLPRESRDSVAWVSRTRPHHDGIEVAIVLRPEASASAVAGSISFETMPFQIEIPISELDHYEAVYDVGDEKVAIHAFRVKDGDCETGKLRGVWGAANEHGVGKIHGRILDEAGHMLGHLRGKYGTRDDGRQVFFAKVINDDGRFIGRLRGEWGEGKFSGHFEGKHGHHGLVRGRYLDAPTPVADPSDPAANAPAAAANSAADKPQPSTRPIGPPDQKPGVFVGRWAERCRVRPTTMPNDVPADDMGDGSEPAQPADDMPLVP